ncbi:AlpA family phage regulatory protein [Rhizobium leguminosarum]|uniref:helix-turn-helix transcriptional regulator n=1 Tax=Rhizobium leguminosarum TaxID=384 RepID=UPI0010325BE2|nr:AlpA family phage regulatory protein [Rhizobium leguminosarum]TBC71555.1 AlpA family phage regulatory protein [Rhizobium leguminosarum]
MTQPPLNPRLLRLNDILAPQGPIPVSKSTWWKKVKTGEYPVAIKISPRVTCWKESDILDLLKRFEVQP